jgi:hypothetical protein
VSLRTWEKSRACSCVLMCGCDLAVVGLEQQHTYTHTDRQRSVVDCSAQQVHIPPLMKEEPPFTFAQLFLSLTHSQLT